MASGKPIFLGIINYKEYYLNPPDKTHKESYLTWRVPDIRESIIAPPGYKVMGADFSQIEIRIMAKISNDQWLISALNSGKDIHCYMASDVYGIPYDIFYKAYKDETDPLHDDYTKKRSDIKTTTFGTPYGATKEKIALMTGLPVDREEAIKRGIPHSLTAEDLIAGYFAKAVGLRLWLDDQTKFAQKYGYTCSMRNRTRFYRLPSPQEKEYNKIMSQIGRYAGNQPIQSTCSDLLKMSLFAIYSRLRGGNLAGPMLYDAKIALCVHDEIIIICKDEDIEPVKAIMVNCMQHAYDILIGLDSIKHETDVVVSQFWKKG